MVGAGRDFEQALAELRVEAVSFALRRRGFQTRRRVIEKKISGADLSKLVANLEHRHRRRRQLMRVLWFVVAGLAVPISVLLILLYAWPEVDFGSILDLLSNPSQPDTSDMARSHSRVRPASEADLSSILRDLDENRRTQHQPIRNAPRG